jgi:hypothetical protein
MSVSAASVPAMLLRLRTGKVVNPTLRQRGRVVR